MGSGDRGALYRPFEEVRIVLIAFAGELRSVIGMMTLMPSVEYTRFKARRRTLGSDTGYEKQDAEANVSAPDASYTSYGCLHPIPVEVTDRACRTGGCRHRA